MRRRTFIPAAIGMLLLACMETDQRWYTQDEEPDTEWEKAGRTFVQHLTHRRYRDAHEMLTHQFKQTMSEQDLAREILRLTSEQFRPMEEPWVLSSLSHWPAKERADEGMAYVQIGGDGNEAIMVTVASEDDALRVRAIEWGRP